MCGTVTASDGVQLPIDSLDQSFTYVNGVLTQINVTYRNQSYGQFFTYINGQISEISQWTAGS